MGNSQSSIEAAAPRKSNHKLSKPRIGNPAATAGLLSPNGLSTSTIRFSNSPILSNKALPLEPVLSSSSPIAIPSAAPVDASPDIAELPATDDMVEVPGIQKKESQRRSLFRSLSYQKVANSLKSTRRTSSVGPSPRKPPAAEKVDRTKSMTADVTHIAYYAAPSAENWSSRSTMGSRRTSWNYDMNSYEAKRLLNLIEEPAFDYAATVSERNTVVSEATWKSSNPSQPVAIPQISSTPISRANSDISLYTPVRRRSIIQTPGVATRTRTLTSAPPPRPNFRHSVPPTPSMSRQQSFDSIRSGIISMPPRIVDPDSLPRVVTPSELDHQSYQSIGAFKLGSLRITNGAASPISPELERKGRPGERSSVVTRERTDYFSAKPARQGVTAEPTVEPLDDKTQTIVAPQPRTSNLSPIAASFLEADAARAASPVVKNSPPKLSDIPQEFLEEISFTPFTLSDSRPLSPELQTTSKHTAIEDELFDDDANPEYSMGEVLDVRLDPNAKSQVAVSKLDTQLSMRTVSRTDSGFVSAGSPASEVPLKPLTKADSGYSSNVSLRSFTASKSQLTDKESTRTWTLDTASSPTAASPEQQPQKPARVSMERPVQPSREPPPPPVPPKDMAPPSPSRLSGGSAFNKALTGLREARLSTSSPSGNPRHTPSPINSMRSLETVPRSPESMPRTPKSARSDISTSALSIGSGSNRPSKLHRLLSGARRSTHGPPMVHVTHALDKTAIPSIPQDIEIKLREHAGQFPMTTKRLALKPQQSKDTLKTIFSVGSMEINLDAMNPTTRTVSPALSDDVEDYDESHTRHLVHSVQHSIAHAASHIITRKPIARKPIASKPVPIPIPRAPSVNADAANPWTKHNKKDNGLLPAEADLTSFHAISSSLGSNPYDAALKAMGETSPGMLSPPPIGARAMSWNSPAERTLHPGIIKKMPSASSLVDRQGIALPSPLLPRELMAVRPKPTKTPPPVSMMTRPNGSLRKPKSLRSLRRQQSAQSLSRQSSRESIHSYPAAGPPVQQPSLSRRNSRDHVQSYPSYQQPPLPTGTPVQPSLSRRNSRDHAPSLSRSNSRDHVQSYPSFQQPPLLPTLDAALSPPPIPRLDPRRSMSLRPQPHPSSVPSSPYRAPNWDPHQVNGPLSRRSSMSSMSSSNNNNDNNNNNNNNNSRNNSFSSSRSHQGQQQHHVIIQRPASTQPYHHPQARPISIKSQQQQPPLRHRASYDGYSHSLPSRGFAPSMSNGYTAPAPPKPVIDPRWNNNNNNNRHPMAGKQDQYGVYPPFVPRGGGHHRNRSMGNHGYPVQAPYRVLHSYNSPAYRNVPIWG